MSMQPSENDVDGNAIRKGIKYKDELAEKILGPRGFLTKIFTIIDVHLLVLFIGVQFGVMNFYILKYNSMLTYYYILYAFDLITIVIVIWSIVIAKRYFELQDRIENPDYYSKGIDCNPKNGFGKDLVFCRLPKQLGVLPFIYICWLVYTFDLTSKILIIFITNVPSEMLNEQFKIGPQTIEMIIAITSIIFLLFMYAHRNSQNEYHRKITKHWIDEMFNHTVFEIFDSIMFLDLVIPERDHHHDHMITFQVRDMNPWLEYTIIFLASANFFIPTINLYHLSQLSACKGNECKLIDLKGKRRHILIHFLRLFSVNCAYLAVRIYVSTSYDKALTIFIIKNALCIIMSFRSLFIEIHQYYSYKKAINQSGSNKKLSISSDHHHHNIELHNLSSHINDKLAQNGLNGKPVDKDLPNINNFEDITLK